MSRKNKIKATKKEKLSIDEKHLNLISQMLKDPNLTEKQEKQLYAKKQELREDIRKGC